MGDAVPDDDCGAARWSISPLPPWVQSFLLNVLLGSRCRVAPVYKPGDAPSLRASSGGADEPAEIGLERHAWCALGQRCGITRTRARK
jgi:hypothetical protein